MDNQAYWPGTKVQRGSSIARATRDAGVACDDSRPAAVRLLNQALTIARVGALRCERQYVAAVRGHSPVLAATALERANEAQTHATLISKRISELGFEPDRALDASPPRGGSDPGNGHSLFSMVSHHLATERATIKIYREIAAGFAGVDRPSQKLFERIIAYEEQCARDLAKLLDTLSVAAPQQT